MNGTEHEVEDDFDEDRGDAALAPHAGMEVPAEKLEALRERLSASPEALALAKPKDLEDASLGRFVRARDGDVDAAFAQMMNVLRWRREHKVDLILERKYEFVAQDRWGMAYWHGKDFFDRPILVIRGIRHDPTLFSTETTVRYLIWKLETKFMDPAVDDIVVIFDFINMGRNKLDMKLVRIMIPLLLNFYPERLGVCLVYPTMKIMWIFWKMVSKAFDEKTEKKFVFVREQKRDNKFLRLIPEDQLQTRFGGTSTAEYGTDLLGLIPPDTLDSAFVANEDLAQLHRENAAAAPETQAAQAGTDSEPAAASDHAIPQEGPLSSSLAAAAAAVATPTTTTTTETADAGAARARGQSQDCLGPRAFESLSLEADGADFDTDMAVREYREIGGNPFDEDDDDFRAFMDARDQDLDRYQVRLRYQVSHLCLDNPDSNSDDASSTLSPASDSHAYSGSNIHLTISDAGTVATSNTARTTGGKRARFKHFIRKRVLRRKSEHGSGSHRHHRRHGKTKKAPPNGTTLTSSIDSLLVPDGGGEAPTFTSQLVEAAEAGAALQAARAQAEEDARALYTRLHSGSDATSEQMHEQHVLAQQEGKIQARPRMDGMEHRTLSSSGLLPQSPSRRGVIASTRSASFRRSSRRGRGSREEKTHSIGFTPDKIKFVMEAGASMKRVPYEDPGRECNTWSPCSAARFMTRIGPDYKKKKLKEPSGSALYDCVCMDVWSLQSKRPNIGSYMQLPVARSTGQAGPGASGHAAPLPELLIVNIMMPAYPPTGPFSKKRIDGPGQSIVLFAKLSNWAKENPEDPSVQLWSRFVHVYDGDKFRERLKMITRLENADEVNLGRIERTLLAKYNGTPWLVRPEYEFHKGEGYFEICIDFHRFAYFALSNAMPVLDRVFNAIIDCALIVQSEKDQEMPERVLVCATIRCPNLKEAPEIDLVALSDESKRRSSRLSGFGTSFIDRDGRVHSLAKRSVNPLATSPRRMTTMLEADEGSGSARAATRSKPAASAPAVPGSMVGSRGDPAKRKGAQAQAVEPGRRLWAVLAVLAVLVACVLVLLLAAPAPGPEDQDLRKLQTR